MIGCCLSHLLLLGTDINLSWAVSREASCGGQHRTHWLGCSHVLLPRLAPLPSGFLQFAEGHCNAAAHSGIVLDQCKVCWVFLEENLKYQWVWPVRSLCRNCLEGESRKYMLGLDRFDPPYHNPSRTSIVGYNAAWKPRFFFFFFFNSPSSPQCPQRGSLTLIGGE